MILLDRIPTDAAATTVAIFGSGLIGCGTYETLRLRTQCGARVLPVDWADPEARTSHLREAETAIRGQLQDGARLNVLWAAGRAGFTSTDQETDGEWRSFTDVLAMVERVAREFPRTSFHFVSSAGGLFDGQRHVTPQSQPAPFRPYGRLKLRQEELLQASAAPLMKRIYRVTSTYGNIRSRFRPGLVGTLVLNGVRRAVTQMSGRMDTLRDFVFIDDVASYIADRLLDDDDEMSRVLFLARARPCSLFEVQHIVEEAMGRKLYVTWRAAENAEDITFAPSILPRRWLSSDLRANIGRIYRDLLRDGLAGGFAAGRNAA